MRFICTLPTGRLSRGVTKTYPTICENFATLFKLHDVSFQYQFKLRSVFRSGDLATARITWYLTEYHRGKKISTTQDEGLDVFQKNTKGHWRIVSYLAYPVCSSSKK
jgi:ketosteroid isomerase-like protein